MTTRNSSMLAQLGSHGQAAPRNGMKRLLKRLLQYSFLFFLLKGLLWLALLGWAFLT